MSENHNGHRSVWQQVGTEEPFIWTQYLQSHLTTQNYSREQWEEVGQFKLDITCGGEPVSNFISPVWERGGRKEGGEETERSSQEYQDYRENPDHSHLVSNRASNYCVTGEEDIKPGSIPQPLLTPVIKLKLVLSLAVLHLIGGGGGGMRQHITQTMPWHLLPCFSYSVWVVHLLCCIFMSLPMGSTPHFHSLIKFTKQLTFRKWHPTPPPA